MGVEGRKGGKRVRQCGPYHAYASMTPIHQNCVCTRLLALLSLIAASPQRRGGKQADRNTRLWICVAPKEFLSFALGYEEGGRRAPAGRALSPITLVSICL